MSNSSTIETMLSDNIQEVNTEYVISDDMIAEEEKLKNEGLKSKPVSLDNEPKYEAEVDKRRLECFQKLMKHSEAYTQFLREKMATQVNLRRFERIRKFNLMRSHEPKYIKMGIPCEKYMNDTKVVEDDADVEDPQSVLDGEMLNINGEVVSMKQPFTLENATLRPYQLEGLHWLKVLYENGVNGILADEMGLGKTIQCISAMTHLLEMGVKGPFLVVAPLSTLSNWMTEFRRFASKIPVVLYHGTIDQRLKLQSKIRLVKFLDIEAVPVLLTSYEIAMKDRPFLDKFTWKYLVIDEGHRIKNFDCRLVRELKRLKTSTRLLLTGTPLQNNLSELWSLMNFLLPEVFGDLASFEMWFNPDEILDSANCSKIIKQEQEQQVLQSMHRILRPFLLRRMKSEVALNIPPKKEVLVYAPLTKIQEEYYKATLDKSIRGIFKVSEAVVMTESPRKKFKNDKETYHLRSKTDPVSKNVKLDFPLGDTNIKLSNSTMQLRKIVNHPYLIHYPINPATEEYQLDESLVTNSGKLLVMDAMLSRLKNLGHKVLVFSQMVKLMDILEDYLYLRKYQFVRLDGSMGMEERQAAIDKFTKGEAFVFLLSTRAGGLGINLTAADTVIIYDSDWNPQVDLQAMDRCHRIGQTKPVVVYRLVTAGTIDEHMVKKATGKKKLEMMIIQKGKFKEKKEQVHGISIQELQDLLKSNDHDVCIQPNGFVFSDEELDSLLDRSHMFLPAENKQDVLDKTSITEKHTIRKDVSPGLRNGGVRKRVKSEVVINGNVSNEKENGSARHKQKLYTVLDMI